MRQGFMGDGQRAWMSPAVTSPSARPPSSCPALTMPISASVQRRRPAASRLPSGDSRSARAGSGALSRAMTRLRRRSPAALKPLIIAAASGCSSSAATGTHDARKVGRAVIGSMPISTRPIYSPNLPAAHMQALAYVLRFFQQMMCMPA